MSDTVNFGDGIRMRIHASTCDTIFAHIRKYASDDDELMQLIDKQEAYDAQGGWFFSMLSLNALERLRGVLLQLEANLPDSISNWNVDWRPLFHANFAEFKEKLGERIAQLKPG